MRYILLLFLTVQSNAQMRSNLFKKPEAEIKDVGPKSNLGDAKKVTVPRKKITSAVQSGNLPSYYFGRGHFSFENSPIVLPSQKQNIKLSDLNSGEVITAEIKESLIAFNDSKAPVRAVIKSGRLKDSVLIGEATLEKNSKRILIDFKKLRTASNNQNYEVIGYALDEKGILGLKGNLISGEGKYFAAEFLSAAAAGVADASIERSQNSNGNYVEKPSTDTLAKKALVGALSTTTNHFSEKLKKAPEYSILEGSIEIQILITEQPTLIN